MELIGLYLAACCLLIAAGASKAVRPDGTARALADLLPVGMTFRGMKALVRAGATSELALGLVAILVPSVLAVWLVAASYWVFAVVVVHARARGGALASCGCFGTPDTPATSLHVVVDIVLGVGAAAVALARPAGPMASVLAHQPGHGVPLAAISFLLAALCYLALTGLAHLQAARALTPVSFRREP